MLGKSVLGKPRISQGIIAGRDTVHASNSPVVQDGNDSGKSKTKGKCNLHGKFLFLSAQQFKGRYTTYYKLWDKQVSLSPSAEAEEKEKLHSTM